MANVNKVIFVGRLTRDPECRTFPSGGKVADFGFAVTNRRKNAQTGQWEDEPMFIDCKAFNRGETGRLADIVEQYLKKGSQAYIEGKLHLETWDDKTSGQKRQKHKVYVDVMQMLDTKADAQARMSRGGQSGNDYNGGSGEGDFDPGPPASSGQNTEETIPF